MKLTLLEIVQKTLSAMDSEPVNSITDTEEAGQVAQICEDAYYELLESNNYDWEFLKRLREAEALSNSSYPNYLKIPDSVSEVYDFRYNVQDSQDNSHYTNLQYLNPEQFLDLTYARNADHSNVVLIDNHTSVPLFIYNDQDPTYWTTFNDEYLVTDSYNKDEDSTLQASKSLIHCLEIPTFTIDDNFTPDLPGKMFPLLLAQVKVDSFYYLKQTASEVDIRKARRLRNIALNKEYRANARNFHGFGRK